MLDISVLHLYNWKSAEKHGILAQLGEHLPYKQRVTGSSPVGPTHNHLVMVHGGIAQLARACGSYPQCRGFKSPSRYFKKIKKSVDKQNTIMYNIRCVE